MKFNFTIIFFLFLSNLVSQQSIDSLHINYTATDVSLAEVFTALESEYGIRFSYATSTILDHPISVKFENESLDYVLDYLLSDRQMEYKLLSNNILLRKSNSYTGQKSEKYDNSIHLKGRVIEPGHSTRGLELATVAITNTSLGTYTDEKGRFDIEIPKEHLSEQLIIHALGYKDLTYKIKELENNFVLVSMQDGGYSIEEVTIVNREKPVRIDNINNSIGLNKYQLSDKTSGIAGSDLNRQLQLLPGISTHDDTSAEIKIRGSESDETMIILDGLPIYHASHYYGIFSGINTAFIDSVNVYKNNYPLQYDGKTGGVVELHSSNQQAQKIKGNLEINLLTASVNSKIPLSQSTTLSVAGRTSLGNVSNSQFNTFATESTAPIMVDNFKDPKSNQSTDPKFNFYDLNVKIRTQLREKDILSVQFYKSSDRLSNIYNRRLEDSQKDELLLMANEQAYWDNIALGVNYQMQLSRSFQWDTRLYHTRYRNTVTNDYSIETKKQGPMQGPPPSSLTTNLRSNQTNMLFDTGIDSYVQYSDRSQKIQLGFSTIQHDLQYKLEENNNDRFNGAKVFYESSIYVSYANQINDKFSLNTGLRSSYFDLNKGNYISPRILINYKLSDCITTKVSYGYYQQVIRQFQYEYRGEPLEIWVSAGQNNIPVLKSHNMMLGTTAKFEAFTIDLEAYQKNMNGMIEYAVLEPGNGSADPNVSRDYMLFEGDGIIRGIDLLLSTGYKYYNTYISYSLSKSQQRFDAIAKNGYFPTENDRRHQFKWINSYKTGSIIWGANAIYISGRRYTDIESLGEQGNITESNPDQRFKRLPAYQRLDLSSTFNFNISKYNSSVTIALYNSLNNLNVKYVQSITTTIEKNQTPINTVIGSDSNLLGRTINLSFKVGLQ